MGCPAEIGTDDDSQISLTNGSSRRVFCPLRLHDTRTQTCPCGAAYCSLTTIPLLCLGRLGGLPISASQDIALEILVSSAKHLIVECVIQPVISLMKMRNKMGLRTVP